MKKIYDYCLPIVDQQHVYIPEGAQIISVAMQDDVLCLWAIVETVGPIEEREILIRGTGDPLTGSEGRFIGTISDELVWHVFEGKK